MKDIVFMNFLGFPVYGWLWGWGLFIFQRLLYVWANMISDHFGIPWHVIKIKKIDDAIPLRPVWFIIYVLSYAYWVASPIIIARFTDGAWYTRYIIATLVAYFIGFFIFTFYPTYMNRTQEDLYNRVGDGIWGKCMKWVYNWDGKEKGTNLFPSYHCLHSTLCLLGLLALGLPLWVNALLVLFTISIYASTVLCKQHYILDIPSGIIISVVSYICIVCIH